MVDCAAQKEHDVAMAETGDIINQDTADIINGSINEDTGDIIKVDTTDITNEDITDTINEDTGDIVNDDIIRENHFVLVKTPSENSKLIKIQNNATTSLGKFGSFFTAQLLGKHYDTTYQVLPDKTLSRIDTSSVLSAFELDFENPADSTATNVDFVDDSSTQALSHADIETLKEESFVTGADGQIIQKLIDNSKTFSKKTEFAKAKYIKNKAKKYSKIITLLPPTAKNLCEYYFEKNPEKILSIRIDTLSQLLTLANVRPSAKFMVIDEADGLIVGSILEKTGGFSQILGIHEREAHVYQVPLNMNFPDSYNDFLYKIPFNAVGEPIVSQSFDESLLPEQAVVDKKERIAKTLKKLRDADALLQPCDFNGLIIVCNSPTIPIIQKLTKYLGGSSQLVVYSPSKELLLEPYMYLLKSREFINIQLTESFLREYQIPLQGMAGTHPHMMTSASGGFLLSATRVLDTIEVGFKPPVNKDRKSGRGKKRRRY